MPDLSDVQAAQSVKLVGANSSGTETNPVGSSANLEITNVDTVNTSARSGSVALTTTAIELYVSGGARLSNRKYIWMQALDNGVKWGLSSGTQDFDLFKNQLLCFPIGNVPIYAKMSTGTGNVAFGEGA